jgi:hypothetical protein
MTVLNQEDSILLIIDIQEKLLNAVFNQEIVGKNSEIISKSANILDLPIYITEQYPKGLGSTVGTIKEVVENGNYFEKISFNALFDIDLLSSLKKTGRRQVIVMGIETHICVHQTVDALIQNGFEVTVAADACGSRFENSHKAGLESIKDNGAKIKSTEMILFELLKSAKHPKFKEIQALIK